MRATYILSTIFLILIAVGDAFAWDDDDFDSFHKHTSTQRQNSVVDFGNPKKSDHLDSTIYLQPIARPKLETIQQSIDRQNREMEEFTARTRRDRAEQEARGEQGRIQQEKQQAIYDEKRRQECEMAEFVGGVYKAKFAAVTGRDSAVTTEGYIFRSGDNFITPRGIYSKDRDVYAGPDGITTQSGDLFFGTRGTTIQAGGAFFTEGTSGYVVGPNCFNKPAWRSR